MKEGSLVIKWLLLAATLSVDAVASFLVLSDGPMPALSVVSIYLALTYAQLSVLCAWVILVRPSIGWSWLTPFVAGGVFAIVPWISNQPPSSISAITLFSMVVAVWWVPIFFTLPVLWLLKPIRIFRQTTGNDSSYRWQFSTKHLLLLTTGLAFLLAFVELGWKHIGGKEGLVSLAIANTMLLITMIAIVQQRWFRLLRLAVGLAVACMLGVICNYLQIAYASWIDSIVFNLIQAIVIWPWLEVMREYTERTEYRSSAN